MSIFLWANLLHHWDCHDHHSDCCHHHHNCCDHHHKNPKCITDVASASALIDQWENAGDVKSNKTCVEYTTYVHKSTMLTSNEKKIAKDRIKAGEHRYGVHTDELATKMEKGFANYLISHNMAVLTEI